MNQDRGVFHPQLWDRLRDLQALALPDACKIGAYTQSRDTRGGYVENYIYGDEMACRFNVDISMARSGYEILGQSEIPRNDTFIALPINATTTALAEQDRIRITRRQNEAISPNEDWEVASPVNRGTANIFVRLRPVDDYVDPT